MRTLVVLQARTSSTRLPGKVLLPVGGCPIARLAAERAGNTGLPVLVVTSADPSDDELACTLRDAGIGVFRGSLDDVLQRFADACAELGDDTEIVRLTADNVFPDGPFIEDVLAAFREQGVDYLQAEPRVSGLPHGMSAEVFRARLLREAAHRATEAHEREHVTPWIRSQGQAGGFDRHAALGLGHLRCTIDTPSDYLRVLAVFRSEGATVATEWKTLCDTLASQAAVHRFVLGGAQLGMAYGVVNTRGEPDQEEVDRMVSTALAHGVFQFDTARAYGDSERKLSEALHHAGDPQVLVVTKLPPLGLDQDATCGQVGVVTHADVMRSCRELDVPALSTLLVHRLEDALRCGGVAWRNLLDLKRDGFIRALGCSVQTPAELEVAAGLTELSHLQVPFNLLDHRWSEAKLRSLADQGVVIHTRSALLQGLLAADSADAWQRAGGAEGRRILGAVDRWVEQMGRADRIDLCLAYVRAHDWVSGVVVGQETCSQLEENLRRFAAPPLTADQVEQIRSERPELADSVLDPAQWP